MRLMECRGVGELQGLFVAVGGGQFYPAGTSLGDFNQITVGEDVSFAWHHWQLWAEAYACCRFQVPNVGNADTLAYYIEAKYKITAGLFAAVRWNQQFFGEVPNGLGGQQPWDHDVDRVDISRWVTCVQTPACARRKIQYRISTTTTYQQGEQLAAAAALLSSFETFCSSPIGGLPQQDKSQ